MARVFNLTFSARDPMLLARFWSQALSSEIIQVLPDLVRLSSAVGGANMLFLRVDGAAPPSTLHLDLAASDPLDESIRLVGLGATALDVTSEGLPQARHANGLSWFVLADPEGNEFCIGGEPAQSSTPSSTPSSTREQIPGTNVVLCEVEGSRQAVTRASTVFRFGTPGGTQRTSRCAPGNARAVTELLAAGAFPNSRTSTGWTPLHAAAFNGVDNAINPLIAGWLDHRRRRRRRPDPSHRRSTSRSHSNRDTVTRPRRQHRRIHRIRVDRTELGGVKRPSRHSPTTRRSRRRPQPSRRRRQHSTSRGSRARQSGDHRRSPGCGR